MKKILPVVLISFLFILIDSCSKKEIKVYELTTSASPAEGGSVSPSSGSFTSGKEVSITAKPSGGYVFKNWSGSITGTTNPVKMTMNSDKELTAVFEMPDADNDGVPDSLDQCPDTSQGESVDKNGCTDNEKDSDGDGVDDATDLCPETPEGETVEDDGCSDSQKDTDGDGITDDIDLCADTPDGEVADAKGCSENQVDTDGDTITDDLDQCPDTPDGETVDEFGCSGSQKDTDADGITDDLDKCQNTPDGETVDSTGCSENQVDTDGDTLTDDLDQCADTPDGETIDEQGCSESQKDDDGDGVNNLLDECPDTPDGEGVNSIGCSSSQEDTDGDGVTDDKDQCPGTPDGETADEEGCSESQKDSDTDGVSDDIDQCPDTPNGESVNAQGCSTSQTDSDKDGVVDNADECPNTPAGTSVDAQGCSDGQKDKLPPVFTNITVTDITSTSFKVDWSLDEGSKGYIRFGTSQGVYVGSTNIEDDFLTRHIQPVGGNNPFPLNPETTYYWQIYVEDQYGNTGFSDERSTTTLGEVSQTYVPDDVFEQNLIDLGYDDVIDDYVLTENISNVTVLELFAAGNYRRNGRGKPFLLWTGLEEFVLDYTGLEGFVSLQELTLNYMSNSLTNDIIDLSRNPTLKKLVFYQTDFNGIDLSGNQMLVEIIFQGADEGGVFNCTISNLDLRSNINLKKLSLIIVNYFDNLNLILERVPSLEEFIYGENDNRLPGSFVPELSFVNNSNLRTLVIGGDCLTLEFIDLKNGANLNLESITIDPLCYSSSTGGICIEADNPTYVSGVISAGDGLGNLDYVIATENCEY